MRIASLAPSVTEILFELGAQDEIVCNTIYCDYPEAAKSVPKVGSWVKVDFDKISSFAPEIVFTSSAVQGELTRQLRDRGLRTVNINPMRLAEVIESYNQIGALVDRKEQADQITRSLYKKTMSTMAHVTDVQRPRVYCEEWSAPPMAAGNWVPDIVEMAGGETGIVPAGQLSREIELAEVQAFNPHLIVLHLCGMGDKVDPATIKNRSGWEDLIAVKTGNIKVLDDSYLNRPTSRLFQGLDILRSLISEVRISG